MKLLSLTPSLKTSEVKKVFLVSVIRNREIINPPKENHERIPFQMRILRFSFVSSSEMFVVVANLAPSQGIVIVSTLMQVAQAADKNGMMN